MSQSHFSLAWDAHKTNICHGLSTLQQNGEFVDMTLAADGHMVKVHQIILALASPFIKELISSADCSHPVIYLNKISYETLGSILEYIYTGEVLVSIENLNEFVEAGKGLHIKGLEDMSLHETMAQKLCTNDDKNDNIENLEDDVCYFEIAYQNEDEKMSENSMEMNEERSYKPIIKSVKSCYEMQADETELTSDTLTGPEVPVTNKLSGGTTDRHIEPPLMQYTVSNQGNLQIILNRYIYYLKHSNKNNTRNWRCVDYLNNKKCPAQVITKDNMVLQRISVHKHSFHDKKILKKIHTGAVFSALQDAEEEGHIVRDKCYHDKQQTLLDIKHDE